MAFVYQTDCAKWWYAFEKAQNGFFRYLDTPPTLRAKSSIKELTDLVFLSVL